MDNDDTTTPRAFDDIMLQVGNSGKFQKRFNILFNFAFIVSATLSGFNVILSVAAPEHWCRIPGIESTNYSTAEWKHVFIPRNGDDGQLSHCKMFNVNSTLYKDENGTTNKEQTGCLYGWEYDKTYYVETLSSQENWVCDRDVNIANFLVFSKIGEIVGTFLFSPVGDKYGRRPVFYATIIVTLIGRVGLLLSKGIYTLLVIFAVIGNLPGLQMYTATLVIGLEISSIKDRSYMSLLQNIGFSVGLCLGPLIFWAVGDWAIFILISTLPLVPFLFLKKFMIESPRWLAGQGKTKRCVKQLKKIAKANKAELSDKLIFLFDNEAKIKSESEQQEASDDGFLKLFSSWKLAKKTLLVITEWVTFIWVYNILILNVTNLKGNPFMNFFWQSLAELPGYIVGRYLADTLGRRLTKVFSFFAMGITLIILYYFIYFMGEYEILISICGIVVKCFTSVVYYAVQLHTLELYPTSLRQTGSAVGYFVASIFAIFSPYIIYWGNSINPGYPYLFCAILSIFGSLSSMFLPETLNTRLPETVREAELFGQGQKFFERPQKS